MTKFKVGDRVRHKYAADSFEGKVATVIDTNWYGQVLCRLDTGQKGSGVEDNWEFAQPESQPIPDRAMALIRRLAGEGNVEARAVLAEIEPVDADEAEADALYDAWVKDEISARDYILKAIKRGRELERGEA